MAVRKPVDGRRAAVTFRTRLLVIFTLAVVASVGLVELLVLNSTRQAFEGVEAQRVDALMASFRRNSTGARKKSSVR
jgi:hypothetical protein